MTTETTSPEWEDIMKIDQKITALGFGMACILWRCIFICLLISDLDSIQKFFPAARTPLLILKIFSDLDGGDPKLSDITNKTSAESLPTNPKTLLNWKTNRKKYST